MTTRKTDTEIEEGSTNVYTDLGYADAAGPSASTGTSGSSTARGTTSAAGRNSCKNSRPASAALIRGTRHRRTQA